MSDSHPLWGAFNATGLIEELRAEHREQQESLFCHLLEVMDALDRLESHARESQTESQWVLVKKQLEEVLRLRGVRAMESVGKPFDPEFHQAVGRTITENAAPGEIVEEQLRGYWWNDRVLRSPRVLVAASGNLGTPSRESE